MTKFTGSMLILLSVPLAGTVILAVLRDRGRQLPLVPMLIMAIYTFTKITLATCKLFKLRRCCSARLTALKYISFANAFVSIFALRRSMLVSFGEMGAADILRFNLSTGTAVWLLVLFLGIRLLLEKDRSKKED
jgi:hypothetical protein